MVMERHMLNKIALMALSVGNIVFDSRLVVIIGTTIPERKMDR